MDLIFSAPEQRDARLEIEAVHIFIY
jgi:hypothetical protein